MKHAKEGRGVWFACYPCWDMSTGFNGWERSTQEK